MTRGLLTSFIGHALLLAYAVLNLTQEPMDLPPVIPIEATIVTPSELTRLKQGDPQSKQLESNKEPLAISVKADGSVFIGETAVSLDEIAPKLKAIAKNGYDEQIFVRGDKGVAYGTVMRVMGRISAGGFRKVSLVTEVEDGG